MLYQSPKQPSGPRFFVGVQLNSGTLEGEKREPS